MAELSDVGRTAGKDTISGWVHTTDGWPVGDAIVTVADTSGAQAARAGAGATGGFATTSLAPGVYTVVVSATGYQPLARTVVVDWDNPAQPQVFTLARLGALAPPAPGVWVIDPVHSTIRVSAVHLGMTVVHGRFTDCRGQLAIADPMEKSSVEVAIDSAGIDTHNAERDTHLRSADFLDVARHPTITFTSEHVERVGPEDFVVTGPLSIRGVSCPVPLQVSYLGCAPDPWGGTRVGFSASTRLVRDDFAIIWNQVVDKGLRAVGRTLSVNIDIQAVRQ
jgi:polyisoprenoid-binding protein YceI